MLSIYKWHLRKCNLLWYEIDECISHAQSYCYAGHLAHQRRISFDGSAAAAVRTHTAILPGSRFSFALSRLVMQDATRAVFSMCIQKRESKFILMSEKQHASKRNNGSSKDIFGVNAKLGVGGLWRDLGFVGGTNLEDCQKDRHFSDTSQRTKNEPFLYSICA